jgi:hypothetical protein
VVFAPIVTGWEKSTSCQPLEPISPELLLGPAVRTNKRLLAFVGAVISYE